MTKLRILEGHLSELDTKIINNALEEAEQRGMRKVVKWLNNNFEPTIPMTLSYEKWHTQLDRWFKRRCRPTR